VRPDVWAATPFPLSAGLGRALLLGTRKAGDAIDERICRVTASPEQRLKRRLAKANRQRKQAALDGKVRRAAAEAAKRKGKRI